MRAQRGKAQACHSLLCWVETGPPAVHFHRVTSALGRTAARSALRRLALVLHTYLLQGSEEGMKRDLRFGSNLA